MALFGERFSDLYKWGILAVYTFIVDFIILMSLTLGRGLEKQSLFDKSVFHYILISLGLATLLGLAILSIIRNIKEFNLSNGIFLINIKEEKKILEDIDNIKILIKNIESNIPDSIKDKKRYILDKIKKDKYLLEKPQFLNDYSIPRQLLYMYIALVCVRCKYYFGWLLSN